MRRKYYSWALYAAFAIPAIALNWHDDMLRFEGAQGLAKAAVWALFLAFLAYSYYCSSRENIFKTIRTIGHYHWFRQISLDLYIGLTLALGLIYLHQGSLVVVALWLIPTLLFANLAILLYIAIHFDAIVAHFIA